MVDQIILGVVLNVFASGLTGYLYDQELVPFENRLNSPATSTRSRSDPRRHTGHRADPVRLDDLPLHRLRRSGTRAHRPVKTRWGCGSGPSVEHPTAADTVGIRVLWTRYRNVILGGLIAGIGGCLADDRLGRLVRQGHLSGQGYIALAAMIFGRLDTTRGDRRSAAVRLLLGPARACSARSGRPSPPTSCSCSPTSRRSFAVTGFVGRSRAPKADGQPYIKA